jgi:hypothetical protein
MGCDRGRAFDAWFAKACALDPRARFTTCAEQIEALAQALQPGAVRRTGRVARASVLVATAVIVAAVGWRLKSWQRKTPGFAIAPPALLIQPQRAVRNEPAQPATSKTAPTPLTAPTRPKASAVERPKKRVFSRSRAPAKKVEPAEDRIWNEP